MTFGVYLYQLAPRPHPGGSSASGAPAEPGYLVGGPVGQQGSAHEGHPGRLHVDPRRAPRPKTDPHDARRFGIRLAAVRV